MCARAIREKERTRTKKRVPGRILVCLCKLGSTMAESEWIDAGSAACRFIIEKRREVRKAYDVQVHEVAKRKS